jgi:hypothetical protein
MGKKPNNVPIFKAPSSNKLNVKPTINGKINPHDINPNIIPIFLLIIKKGVASEKIKTEPIIANTGVILAKPADIPNKKSVM